MLGELLGDGSANRFSTNHLRAPQLLRGGGGTVGRGPERALDAAPGPGWSRGAAPETRLQQVVVGKHHGVGTVQQVVVLDQEEVARTVDPGRIDVPFGFRPDYWWVPVVV